MANWSEVQVAWEPWNVSLVFEVRGLVEDYAFNL